MKHFLAKFLTLLLLIQSFILAPTVKAKLKFAPGSGLRAQGNLAEPRAQSLELSKHSDVTFTTNNDLDFSTDELIIKYKKLADQTNDCEDESSCEESFIDEVAYGYHLQEQAASHAKYRKLRRAKKRRLKSRLALLKLDRKQNKKQIQKLIRKLNREHYHDTHYQIEAVYPNYLYEIAEDPEVEAVTLNDPLYNRQWAHQKILPEKLWNITKGDGAVVAVIDTGVDYNHQDLQGNIWVNEDEIPGNGKDDDGNGYIDDVRGWDFVQRGGFNCSSGEDCFGRDNDPGDFNGHGTHVAGIVAAAQNNNVGVSGIAPNAKIMPLRAGYSTGFSAFLKTSDILDAITYAINNDADVINMSFAGAELVLLQDVLRLADSLGIVLVAAAGNSSTTRVTFPAGLAEVISVGSINHDNTKSHFSNFGSWVDVVAPGDSVISTIPNNKYDFKSGTSMAAPMVAGIAALIKAKNKLSKPDAQTVKNKIYAATASSQFPIANNSTEYIGALSANIQFPLEVDDIVLPSKVNFGDEVNISAKASDSSSSILTYEWRSDIDGHLGEGQNLTVSTLSPGSHVVTVRVQNLIGEWSEPAFKILEVEDTRQVVPTIIGKPLRYKIKRKRTRLVAKSSRRSRKRIRAYKWISNIDGTVSNSRRVNLDDLSPGFHKISLSVQDRNGVWSEPIQKVIDVRS